MATRGPACTVEGRKNGRPGGGDSLSEENTTTCVYSEVDVGRQLLAFQRRQKFFF